MKKAAKTAEVSTVAARAELITALPAAALMLLAACAGEEREVGVLLWSQEEAPIATGALVVRDAASSGESRMRIRRYKGAESMEVRPARVQFFDSLQRARQFKADYAELGNGFAAATASERGRGGAERQLAYTPELERFFSSVWRPEYVQETLRSDRVDLNRVNPHIGLFPDRAEREIVVNTGRSRIVFARIRPLRTGIRRYSFAEGRLQVEVESAELLSVRYVHHGTAVRERYVKLGIGMKELIEAARERRAEKYMRLRSYATAYRSERYGLIVFRENQSVRWSDRGRAEPEIVPPDAGASAKLRFDLVLSQRLADHYAGAFTLLFDLGPRNERAAFAYRLAEPALRLTHIVERNISRGVVQSIPAAATVMLFEPVHGENRSDGGR